jgi:hypothetical protein
MTEVCARTEGITACGEDEFPQHRITWRKFDISSINDKFFGIAGEPSLFFI